jgi:phage FluMu protein Com
MITPNKLNYGTCPNCKILLNSLEWIPFSALASTYSRYVKCPRCDAMLGVRIKVTFDVEIEEAICNTRVGG